MTSDHATHLKRLRVAIEVNDRTHRLRDDEIRRAIKHGVPAAVLAHRARLSVAEIHAIGAAGIPPLLAYDGT